MTNEEKAREIAIEIQETIGTSPFSFDTIVDEIMKIVRWKDEQFAAERQALIDKACELFCKTHCHGKLTCPMVISSCASFHKFHKAMEETK